jgi:2-methylcitrate dehydratase PrpD
VAERAAQPSASSTGAEHVLWEFATGLTWADVPPAVQRRLAWLTLDLATVSVAARELPSVAIAARYASQVHAGAEATALLDGRRLAAPGAAFANGVLANALDFDDGHRITKGHPGAIVIPAALAAAESRGASCEEFLLAALIGYEVAIRAGIELHARELEYHASGAWGSLGAAVACARLYGLDADRLGHAVNIAEYHAPIAHMSRAVTDPAMTKDAVGWGSFMGMSAALLAEAGFTGLRSQGLDAFDVASLGRDWQLLDVYVKPYPCCRWSQQALDAALALHPQLADRGIAAVEIHTFAAADRLSTRRPETTEEMQYSMVWPVAVALSAGRFGAPEALPSAVGPRTEAIAATTRVVVDPQLDAAFPARRLSRLVVHTADGSVFDSGVLEAPGEAGSGGWEGVVATKAEHQLGTGPVSISVPRPPVGTLAGRTHEQLIAVLTYGVDQ